MKREDFRENRSLRPTRKNYIADHGIREAVFGGNMRDINLIFRKHRIYGADPPGLQSDCRQDGDREIDFVCDKRGEKLYVQVAICSPRDETVHREFGAYDSLRHHFPEYVVTLDELDMSRNGIKHRNIPDFLFAGSGIKIF